MFSSENEINIVIGEAILTLLQDDDDISVRILARQLKKMLKMEKEAARREVIKDAIQQTNRLLATALYCVTCDAGIRGFSREFPCQHSIGHR